MTYLIYKIVKNELSKLKAKDEDLDIIDTIIELAITNELYTRISKESKYKIGKKDKRELKEKIYPYFLMYLGIPEEDLEKHMVRDNIFFDKTKYKYEKLLKSVDLYSFIIFIIKNKKTILNIKLMPVEKIEVL